MNQRRLIGAVAFGLLLLLGCAGRYVPGLSQDLWETWWKVVYVVALCAALFAAFYDRRNFPEKTWDFNPKRGFLYFLLGWAIFPVMFGMNAISGSDFTLIGMVQVTLALSMLVGNVGTFTENVGV
jgi:hypothetical protein